MPDEAFKPAFRAALRMHEIGTASPYRLSFAAKGRSGASFGFMQGDLAAGQPEVDSTFVDILSAQGFAATRIIALVKALSVHLVKNPLSRQDTDEVDAALARESARVDRMDETILGGVYAGLDACNDAARRAGRSIDPKAQIYVALWINVSGAPTKLLTWLSGGAPNLTAPIDPPGWVVTAAQMEAYLRVTSYYASNPGNFPHLQESVAAGAALLPQVGGAPLGLVAAGAAPRQAVDSVLALRGRLPEGADHLVYEQATGRMLAYEAGAYDTLAVGYSGSLSRHAKNDPEQQCVKDAGPIPRGIYTIGSPRKGPSPYSLPLTPDPANDMCGRGGFLIHGDSITHPGDASDGCIVLTRAERETIVASGLARLIVVDRISA